MRVLLIEDDTRLAAALGEQLRDAGYAVDLSADGIDGLFLGERIDMDPDGQISIGADGDDLAAASRQTSCKFRADPASSAQDQVHRCLIHLCFSIYV